MRDRGGNVHDAIHFASFTQLEGTRGTQATYEDPVFLGLPTDQLQAQFVPGGSADSFAHESTENKPNSAAHEMV
jgi:hypothetical protein